MEGGGTPQTFRRIVVTDSPADCLFGTVLEPPLLFFAKGHWLDRAGLFVPGILLTSNTYTWGVDAPGFAA